VVVPLRGRQAKWRPDASVGLGVIHAWVEGPGDQYDVEQDNLAVNVGGGMAYTLSGRVGLRGDLRYFHAFVDESRRDGGYFQDYGFVRATVGVTFRFPRR
jgi:opacity protein-like surface antigen